MSTVRRPTGMDRDRVMRAVDWKPLSTESKGCIRDLPLSGGLDKEHDEVTLRAC